MLSHRVFTPLAVLMVVLLGGGCATTQGDIPGRYNADQLRVMGEKFLAAEDYTQALKFFQWAEARKPGDPLIQYDLGITYDELEMTAEALRHLNRAIELSPQYSDAHNALGRHYARSGNLDLAQMNFEKALANPLYETPHLALFNLGLLHEKKNDPDTALRYYEEATQKYPRYGLAYYRMGEILEAQRRGDQARLAYGKAVEYAPNMPEAHLRYGIMSYMVGELENAIYSLNRVMKLAPNTAMAEEARSYMAQMDSMVDVGMGAQPKVPVRQPVENIDVVREKELVTTAPAPKPTTPPPPEPRPRVSEPQVRETASAVETPPPVPEPPAEQVVEVEEPPVEDAPEVRTGQWTYIVQAGSYLHRRNAEALVQKLKGRGHEAVVKPFKHKVLGNIFVVQLKPVNDRARAASIATGIEREGLAKPIVIKVAAE